MRNRERARILLLITNLDFGGAQTSFLRLSYLLAEFADLRLVVFNKDNMAPLPFACPVESLGVPRSNSLLCKAYNFFLRVIRLKRIKHQFKPHYSISFLEGADYVNALSATGDKIFFYVHGSKRYDRNISGVMGFFRMRFLIPFFYSRADKVMVVNEPIAKELKSHCGVKRDHFLTMPNFYDFNEIRELSKTRISHAYENFFDKNHVIAISGRLAREKGIDRFIKIIPELTKKVSGIKIAILGDGPELSEIIKLLRSLQVSFCKAEDLEAGARIYPTVVFFGYQANPYPFIVRSKLLALPSINEGMPNTIAEALGLGVVVVAADCPYGPRQFLSMKPSADQWPEFADYGILVPVIETVSDASRWIDAIETVLKDKALMATLSQKGLRRAQDFSLTNAIQLWRNILVI